MLELNIVPLVLGGEVVNADSMQLYRGMDIGTAKLPFAERRGIPHHQIDVLDVTDEAPIAAYQADARRSVEDVRSRGLQPGDLRDPAVNIGFGQAWIEWMRSHPATGGQLPKVIASYNAGAGNVRKWVNRYGDPRGSPDLRMALQGYSWRARGLRCAGPPAARTASRSRRASRD